LIAGGTPLQITHDNSEHMYPRWLPDSSALVYYSPPLEGEEQGTLWEVPALGGSPHRLTSSVSSADASHDGSRLAFFRLNERKQVELVSSQRDTSAIRVLAELPASEAYEYPGSPFNVQLFTWMTLRMCRPRVDKSGRSPERAYSWRGSLGSRMAPASSTVRVGKAPSCTCRPCTYGSRRSMVPRRGSLPMERLRC
jgi:hypothetical protein